MYLLQEDKMYPLQCSGHIVFEILCTNLNSLLLFVFMKIVIIMPAATYLSRASGDYPAAKI